MKRPPRLATVAATTLAAVALTVPMSACDSEDVALSVATDSEETATTEAASQPTVPDGYTLTEVSDLDLALAVPSGWTTVSGDASDPSQAESVTAIATLTGDSRTQVIDSLADLDLFSIDTSGTSDYNENISVYNLNRRYTKPTAADMREQLDREIADYDDATMEPVTYTDTTTASGREAVLQTYVLEMDGSRSEGAFITMPIDDGDSMVQVVISTASLERTQELADVILGSI